MLYTPSRVLLSMLLALGVSTVFTSATAFIAIRLVVASRDEAEACGRLLTDTARVLNVTVAQLAPCLGAPARTAELWSVRGVPRAHREEVRALARGAAVLRRHLPASSALHLLELRRRGADSRAEGFRELQAIGDSRPRSAVTATRDSDRDSTRDVTHESRLIRGVVVTSR